MSDPESPHVEPRRQRRIPVHRDVLAVERWAIAVRRLEADVIAPKEREDVRLRPDLHAWFRDVPSRASSSWGEWLQAIASRMGLLSKHQIPPETRPPQTS